MVFCEFLDGDAGDGRSDDGDRSARCMRNWDRRARRAKAAVADATAIALVGAGTIGSTLKIGGGFSASPAATTTLLGIVNGGPRCCEQCPRRVWRYEAIFPCGSLINRDGSLGTSGFLWMQIFLDAG